MAILGYIDKNKAFSGLSVRALKNIKYCAVTISIFYAAGMPVFYLMAEIDDAPGIIVIGLVIIFASMVIAVFAAVKSKVKRYRRYIQIDKNEIFYISDIWK